MKLYIKKKAGVIRPDEQSVENYNKLKEDTIYLCEIKQGRSVKFHRKFFALLRTLFDMQEKYSNMEDLRTEIELKSGNYKEHVTTKGHIIYVPKSISFAKMDEDEFEKLYHKVIDIALKHFIPGMEEDIFREEVERVLEFV